MQCLITKSRCGAFQVILPADGKKDKAEGLAGALPLQVIFVYLGHLS